MVEPVSRPHAPRHGERTERRELDGLVHRVLLVGGVMATMLLVAAVMASLIERRPLARNALSPIAAIRSLAHVHPGGLASLGLVVLILTPVARVIGSLVVFLYERELRFALVTLAVLALMVVSFLLGSG